MFINVSYFSDDEYYSLYTGVVPRRMSSPTIPAGTYNLSFYYIIPAKGSTLDTLIVTSTKNYCPHNIYAGRQHAWQHQTFILHVDEEFMVSYCVKIDDMLESV